MQEQIVNSVIGLVNRSPEYRELLKRVVGYEMSKGFHERSLVCYKAGCEFKSLDVGEAMNHGDNESHFCNFWQASWEWNDVRATPQELKKLVLSGIVTIVMQSNKAKNYRLAHLEATKVGLTASDPVGGARPPTRQGDSPISLEELFSAVIGHDDIKLVLRDLVKSPEPIHALLWGSPATAKTVFLLDIGEFIPGAQYILGGATSRAGLIYFLMSNQPEILLIDEIEKMNREDLTALLSVMETGILREVKYGRDTEPVVLKLKVVAACNDVYRLPRELLSRFEPFIFQFKDYTPAEMLNVATNLLVQRNVPRELAGYIATRGMEAGIRDIRGFVNLSKAAKTREMVDKYADIIKRRSEE
jgi:Holliday junction DNA helicase RuvB